MTGIMYGIGVGPGDPGLMTLRAAERIRRCRVIAIPHSDKKLCTAYQIARQAVPEVEEKECLCLPMPMTRDRRLLAESHELAAQAIMEKLDRGKDVGFLTLGDVSLYSTCSYLLKPLEERGYEIRLECGIPSFCAAAARLGLPLVTGTEQLHIIPASYQVREALRLPGVKVFMKTGRKMPLVKKEIRESGADAVMVENCGMPEERLYSSLDEIPDNPGYYSLLIVR